MLLYFFINSTNLSMLNGVTSSGNVIFWAMERGTPTWSILRLGSGVMTVLAEKSTRFPIKLPLTRPSFPFNLCLTDFSGRPDFCTAYKFISQSKQKCFANKSVNMLSLKFACLTPYTENIGWLKVGQNLSCDLMDKWCSLTFGRPGSSLSVKVATWYCSIFISSEMMCEAAPFCSFRRNWLFAFIMSASLCVKSSCQQERN